MQNECLFSASKDSDTCQVRKQFGQINGLKAGNQQKGVSQPM